MAAAMHLSHQYLAGTGLTAVSPSVPSSVQLSLSEIQQLNVLFMQYDRNKDGKLYMQDMCELLLALGLPADALSGTNEFKMADVDQSGYIDVNEFLQWWARTSRGQSSITQPTAVVTSNFGGHAAVAPAPMQMVSAPVSIAPTVPIAPVALCGTSPVTRTGVNVTVVAASSSSDAEISDSDKKVRNTLWVYFWYSWLSFPILMQLFALCMWPQVKKSRSRSVRVAFYANVIFLGVQLLVGLILIVVFTMPPPDDYCSAESWASEVPLNRVSVRLVPVGEDWGERAIKRLEVMDGAQWGTVCDDNVGLYEARLFCKLAGGSNDNVAKVARVRSEWNQEAPAQIWIDRMTCKNGDEGRCTDDAESLQKCTFEDCCQIRDWGIHDCGRHENVHLENCDAEG